MKPIVLLILAALAGCAQPADVFEDGVVHEIRLHVHPGDWAALTANFGENTFYPADLEWQGSRVRDVAIRSRGLGTRSGTKPGLLVSFDRYVPGRRALGTTAIVLDNSLQDPSFLRERLSMILFARAGLPAPRESYARLFVNGELLGLYIVAEDIGPAFLERNFGQAEGRLYEYKWLYDWRFQSLGDELAPYLQLFEPRNHLRDGDRRELIDLVQTINSTADAGYVSRVGQIMDVPAYLRYVAVEHYLGDWDGQAGTEGINNFYLYLHGSPARFSFIPWDKDVTLQRTDVSPVRVAREFVLLNGLFADPSVQRQYAQTLLEVTSAAGDAGGFLDREARRLGALIALTAFEDPKKLVSNDEFATAVEQVLTFIRERRFAVENEANSLQMR